LSLPLLVRMVVTGGKGVGRKISRGELTEKTRPNNSTITPPSILSAPYENPEGTTPLAPSAATRKYTMVRKIYFKGGKIFWPPIKNRKVSSFVLL